MITATGLELRAGPRLLLGEATFRIAPGDRVGLVGRNGAGKTTLTRVLAGETPAGGGHGHPLGPGRLPAAGPAHRRPATCWPATASCRPAGSTRWSAGCASTEGEMASADPDTHERAMRRYGRLEEEFLAAGGYAAESRGRRDLVQPRAAGAGARPAAAHPVRRAAPARRAVAHPVLLDRRRRTLLLDEPTNHLDADSITWLRDYLKTYQGGLVVISHDVGLLEHSVNRVFHLDANRSEIDVYNVGWKAYLQQRETDERRRKRERANVEKQASVLKAQADRMRVQGHQGPGGAEHGQAGRASCCPAWTRCAAHDRVAKLRFPDPAPCGKTPLMAEGLSKSYGSLEIFTDVDLAIDRGSRVVILGLNGAGKTTLLRLLAGIEEPDTGEVVPGHGLKIGYYAQEHETLDRDRTVLENMRSAAPDLGDAEVRRVLGSFLFSGDDVDKPAAVLSGGEKTRLALATLVVSSANVLLLDEPTNNLDPASREEILGALRTYTGAVVLVTHDEGAVDALQPERLILLPDGVEDLWNEDYADLVALA